MQKRSIYFIFGWILCICHLNSVAQNIDSLKTVLKNAPDDTVKLAVLIELSDKCPGEQIFLYAKPAVELADVLLKNKKNATIIGLKAKALNNIGILYQNQGNIPEALAYYSKSLKLYEEIKEKISISHLYINLATVYASVKEDTKAMEYALKALKMQEELNDKKGQAYSLINIGYMKNSQKDIEGALDCYNKSFKLLEDQNDKPALAMLMNNTGMVYRNLKDYKKALDYYCSSLKIRKEIGDEYGTASSLNSFAFTYFLQKKYQLAHLYCDTALILSKKLGFPEVMRFSEGVLSKIDSATGNFKGAFEHYKQFIIYKDSLNSENSRKASIRNQLNYEFEKKEAVIKEQQEKERAIAGEKNRFQQIVIWSVILGLLLVFVFAVFVLRSLKITKHQKEIIEEKQKEILDSIRYAKRIQTSLLPSEKYIQKHFSNLK